MMRDRSDARWVCLGGDGLPLFFIVVLLGGLLIWSMTTR
jgi:hypothetical protein